MPDLGVPSGEPAAPRPWAKRGEFRSWAREERQAHDALVEARESGDEGLVAAAQRTHREVLGRMPACAIRRRRRR